MIAIENLTGFSKESLRLAWVCYFESEAFTKSKKKNSLRLECLLWMDVWICLMSQTSHRSSAVRCRHNRNDSRRSKHQRENRLIISKKSSSQLPHILHRTHSFIIVRYTLLLFDKNNRKLLLFSLEKNFPKKKKRNEKKRKRKKNKNEQEFHFTSKLSRFPKEWMIEWRRLKCGADGVGENIYTQTILNGNGWSIPTLATVLFSSLLLHSSSRI